MEESKTIFQMKKLKFAVIICAVLFGLWIMRGNVSAATIRQDKKVTTSNPVYYIDYSLRADGNYDMNVSISLAKDTYTQGFLNKIKGYRMIISTEDKVISEQKTSYSYNSLESTPYVLATEPIQPNTTFYVTIKLYSDAECNTLLTDYEYTSAEFTAPEVYKISTDKNAPVSISLGQEEQEIKGPAGVQGGAVYYTFTLKDAATITGSISGMGRSFLYNKNGNEVYRENGASEINWELPEGTYVFTGTPSGNEKYSLKLKSTSFNWGNVNVQWGVSEFPCPAGKLPYTVTVTGGDSRVEIYEIKPSSGSKNITSEDKMVATGNITAGKVGENSLTVVLSTSGNFGYKKWTFPYSLKPETPAYNVYDLTVSGNLATVKVNCDNSYVEIYKNGKWEAVNTSGQSAYNDVVIKGLKANTQYKFRVYVMENGYKSTPSNEVYFYTAHSAKPSIKSVKVSKVKAKKYPKEWHSGHFDAGGNWHPGYYTPAYTLTSYKLTVTLKKTPPKGASTYVAISNHYGELKYCKAKGKKYVVSGSYKGKPGQKIKVNVCYGRNSTYGGLGKSVSKKVTIK